MKLARYEIYMLAIASLAFGCSDGFRTGGDSGIREARRAIAAIDVSRQSSAKSFHESVLKACLQIRTCADARVRSELLNSLADRMLSADLRGRTYYGREQMLGNYTKTTSGSLNATPCDTCLKVQDLTSLGRQNSSPIGIAHLGHRTQ